MTAIAIIGHGDMGRTHARAWSELGLGASIKYICGRRPQMISDAPRARLVSEFQTVLDDGEVDMVSVCTPTPSHADFAIRALQAGKNVLLEKPIALSVDDAMRILAASVGGPTLMVGQVANFARSSELLRASVQSGELGTVLSARSSRMITRPEAAWWHDKEMSGGLLVDLACHDFDQINGLLGEPLAVTCHGSAPTGPVETSVEYRSGAIAQILTTASIFGRGPFIHQVQLVGTDGVAQVDSVRWPAGPQFPAEINTYRILKGSHCSTVRIDDPPGSSYTREVAYFLECSREGRQPEHPTTASAIRALETALLAAQSQTLGHRMPYESCVP